MLFLSGFLFGVSFGVLLSSLLDDLRAFVEKLVRQEIAHSILVVAGAEMPPEKKAKVVA